MPSLFADLPLNLSQEVFETLASGSNVRIERIISHGQSSPAGFWYDQDEAEWIVVLKGEAKLLLNGEPGATHLTAGDYLLIPTHKMHQVDFAVVFELARSQYIEPAETGATVRFGPISKTRVNPWMGAIHDRREKLPRSIDEKIRPTLPTNFNLL